MYCFLGGDDALEEVQGAHRKQVGQIPEALRRALAQVESEDVKKQHLKWDQISKKVGKLAEKRGDTGAAARIQGFYDYVYRGESLASIHGGIGTIGGHALMQSKGRMAVRSKRADYRSSTRVIITGGVLVAILASHLLHAYNHNLDDGWFDPLARVITRVPRRG
jgi:hypothetical protein